jgi:hypothetical protein
MQKDDGLTNHLLCFVKPLRQVLYCRLCVGFLPFQYGHVTGVHWRWFDGSFASGPVRSKTSAAKHRDTQHQQTLPGGFVLNPDHCTFDLDGSPTMAMPNR